MEKVRGTGGLFGLAGGPNVEERFIHLTAAANQKPWALDILDAPTASSMTAARLLPGLQTGVLGEPVANLTNTLAVENVITSATQPYRPTCLNSSSKRPGDLAGIGTDVWSFTGPLTGSNFSTGTSMATPQVAGVAAYVWGLNPLLTAPQVVDILLATTRQEAELAGHPECDPTTLPAPQLDAYAAVLAVDDASALTPGGGPLLAPVRLAVLDVADDTGAPGQNGAFDERDVNLYLVELDLAAGAIDYSRYDLNGDGRTGGEWTDRFDLDIDGAYSGSVSYTIDQAATALNELAVTDLGILCYYAYSLLYTGDPGARASLLAGRCTVGYQVIDLTPLTSPRDLNEAGLVLGSQEVWQAGAVTTLTAEPLDASVTARQINESGHVAGFIDVRLTASGTRAIRAARSQGGALTSLGTLVGPPFENAEVIRSEATGIDDAGAVVGWSETRTDLVHFPEIPGGNLFVPMRFWRAFHWHGGVMTALPSLLQVPVRTGQNCTTTGSGEEAQQVCVAIIEPRPAPSTASAVNGAGQIAGSAVVAIDVQGNTDERAVVWAAGGIIDLGTLPGDTDSEARALNDQGQVVGVSWSSTEQGLRGNPFGAPFGSRAFLWDAGTMIGLGSLGGTLAWPTAINNARQVVGVSLDPAGQARAFLWQDGIMRDLNELIDPASGWVLVTAMAISDGGHIVGQGRLNGVTRGYLLRPGP
jgi:probable HAF family extracellular repeat protein